MTYELHFDYKDVERLYNYTDDLLTIHRQLTACLLDRDLPVGPQVLKTDVAMRTLFNIDVLETEMYLRPKERKSKYALQYAEYVNDIYRTAHLQVIKEFHDCWAVLPNMELDDYRLLSVTPLSLSEDFIAEAMASTKAQAEGLTNIKCVVIPDKYQTHQADAGQEKKAVYVCTAQEFLKDRSYWFSDVRVERQGADFILHGASPNAFMFQNKVYVTVDDNGMFMQGTGWVDSIEWCTKDQILEMYNNCRGAK